MESLVSIKDRSFPWRTVISVALLVIAMGVVMWSINETSEASAQQTANEERIATLEGDLAEAEKVKAPTATEVANALNSASTKGIEVADLQNEYAAIDNGGTLDDLTRVAESLDSHFGDKDKNARTPWYQSTNANAKWEFMSTYMFSGKKVNAIWLCKDSKTGDVLAYTVGVYDADSGLFEQVSHGVTELGAKYTTAD